MKVFGGQICGVKKHDDKFASTGMAKGSYAVYVCDIKVKPGTAHKGDHHDSVAGVNF